jgi:hypothetical protein
MNSELGDRECDDVLTGQGCAHLGHGGRSAEAGVSELDVLNTFLSYYKGLMKKNTKRLFLCNNWKYWRVCACRISDTNTFLPTVVGVR